MVMFLILVLYGIFFQDLKRLLTLPSFGCKIIFCELIKEFYPYITSQTPWNDSHFKRLNHPANNDFIPGITFVFG